MAGRRILAGGRLDGMAVGAAGRLRRSQVRRDPARRSGGGEAEAERREMGKAKRAGAQAGPVAATRRAGLGDVPERVGAGIAVGGGVRCPADADRIEDDEQGARHGQTGSSSVGASLSRAKAALNRARV